VSYAHTITVDLPFDAAVQATRDALATHGFGVLADIDIHAAFAGKLGAAAADELGDYLVLGACNPHLAQQALRNEPDLGLLLPCNVVVRRAPGAPATTVQAINAHTISALSGSPAVADVATDADTRLRAALTTLTTTVC
jgi:uncharacterized protein (DUF302 family)